PPPPPPPTAPGVRRAVSEMRKIDAAFDRSGPCVIPASELAGGRMVVAPTTPLNREYDDVRRFGDAARAGIRRARDAGAVRPLLVTDGIPEDPLFGEAVAVVALEALGGLWEPLEGREARSERALEPVEAVGMVGLTPERSAWVHAVELGRRAARDIGGTEPERMAPPGAAAYCRELFAGSAVTCEVVDDIDLLRREYPLLMAVANASVPVERHRPCVIRLAYRGEGAVDRTLLFAGKGVTYDSGGLDIKAGGAMAGMSRDKGGAGAVAGFFATLAQLKPKGIHAVAELGMVRNSVGAEAFATDDIHTSHAGVRVRIGNTDAEGRLVLSDLLSHLREQAVSVPRPHLFSVATLTGHAVKAMGSYSIAIETRPARREGVAERLAAAGEQFGDPFETSRLRREDWEFVRPRSSADDVLSCNNAASSATPRGHQFPAAFIAIASGLDRHCHRDADTELPFTHIDIGGSVCENFDFQHGRPTGAPVVALTAALIE
ncbi:MAG: leucyl aminopeptidase family protein, partial [Myxococcota bacterium]